MSRYLDDFVAGSVVRIKFNTFAQSFIPSTPSVAPAFAVYKNSTTEITAGITVTVDYDGKAGMHQVAIDTSADPAYTTGEDYDVVFTAGVVDGKDLTRVVLRTFSIENRNRKADVVQLAGQNVNAAAAITFPASVASEATTAARPTLTQIEASSVLAKEATIGTRATQASVDQKPTLTQIEASAILAKEATSISILTAIQNLNNLSAKINVFGSPLLEVPDSGSTLYAFTVIVKDDEDKLVSLDASPTITAANASGANRSGNLSVVANPSTGRYTFTYSVPSTHAAESLRISVSGSVSSEARYIEWIGAVVNYDTLTVLQQITTDLSGKPNLAQIESSTVIAKQASLLECKNAIETIQDDTQAIINTKPTLAQIEGSLVLARENSVANIAATLATTLSGVNTLLSRITLNVGAMFLNLVSMIVGGVGSPKWSADALSLAPTGGGGGSGTGARAVTITVVDSSSNPIQNAIVRLSRVGETYSAQTNPTGIASFSINDATWTVSITANGFTFTPVAFVVASNTSQSYSMTASGVIPPAPFVGLCNVLFSVIHLGNPVGNASVVAILEDENPTVDNYLISRQVTSGITNADGNCVLTMVQFSQFTRGGVYRIKVADPLGRTIHDRKVKIPTQSSANAEDLQDAR